MGLLAGDLGQPMLMQNCGLCHGLGQGLGKN